MKARLLFLIIGLIIISGCNSPPVPIAGQLKILYWDEKMFSEDYGSFISAELPDIEYEVVSLTGHTDSTKELMDYVKQENPDLIFMRSYEEYLKFIETGMLADIDNWVRKDKYDISSIHQGVIQKLRDNDMEKLYGLTPVFSSMALYYNKDLFEKYGFPEPQDQMTWDEVFTLSSRFQGINDAVGYSSKYSAYELIELIGETVGERFVRLDNQQHIEIFKNEQLWEDILEQVNQSVQNSTLELPELAKQVTPEMSKEELFPELSKKELFIEGQSAMTVSRLDLLYRYISAGEKFKLGIVTVPIDPNYPNSTTSFRTDTVFGINANSNHQKEAWEVIKIINGEGVAKVRSQYMNELYSRGSSSREVSGISLDPFYKLTYDNRNLYNTDLTSEFQAPFYKMASNELKELFSQNQSVKSTIKNIQENGEALLKVEEQKKDNTE